METIIQLILPSILLPLILSVVVWYLARRYPIIQWWLSLIWLPSYFLLSGVPTFPPAEAKDWLWILLGLTIFLNLFIKYLFIKNSLLILTLSQTLLLALILIAITWPVLQYQFSLMLISELIILTLISYFIFYLLMKENTLVPNSLRSPFLSMAISCTGLSIVITLTGSLLIGQLAGVLAVILFVFVSLELLNRTSQTTTLPIMLLPFVQLYISILVIARIYVELPLEIVVLLLAAPLPGLVTTIRFGTIFNLLGVVIAIGWIVFSADSSSYY